MIEEISQNGFTVKCMDGAEGMLALPDKSIKLVYGSPPYPNAERDYGVWRAAEYIDKRLRISAPLREIRLSISRMIMV